MLYVVGTPIGNLQDLSYRQAKTLADAEIIVTEDTRSTGLLLRKIPELFSFQVKENQKLISYYKEKEFEKLPQILDILEEDRDIVLISQAGLPLISDPGYLLVKTCIKRNIPFTVIPGPTAVTTALLYSGFNPENFMFVGFFPKKENDLRKVLQKLKEVKTIMKEMVFIAFDSPLRIQETVRSIQENMPESEIALTRELTKMYEEIIRGKASDFPSLDSVKGEITIVIS